MPDLMMYQGGYGLSKRDSRIAARYISHGSSALQMREADIEHETEATIAKGESVTAVTAHGMTDVARIAQLQQQLEKGTDESKVETMRRILTIMLNGDPMPQLLMHIIRFVMPSKSKPLKKLLYFYYEICPKHDSGGKLKQEMILVW